MSETDLFPLDPDYAVAESIDPGVLRQRAASGRDLERKLRPPQRLFQLRFLERPTDEVEQIRDWYARFQSSFFNWLHKVYVNNAGTYLQRRFPVVFAAEPEYELAQNEAWNVTVSLLEAVGRALPAANYPDPTAGHPSFFIEEDAPDAKALAGLWTVTADANAHAGQHKTNPNTNTTDAFQFLYAGYGFRLWAAKAPNAGIMKVLLDEVDLGNVDLYAAVAVASAPLLTKFDVPLGLHRVKLLATNTKNAAATGQLILADAIEAMP